MSALGDAGMNRFLDRSSILLTSTKIGHATIVACSIFLILENRTRERLNAKKVARGDFFIFRSNISLILAPKLLICYN